jgi:hypothetical protein
VLSAGAECWCLGYVGHTQTYNKTNPGQDASSLQNDAQTIHTAYVRPVQHQQQSPQQQGQQESARFEPVDSTPGWEWVSFTVVAVLTMFFLQLINLFRTPGFSWRRLLNNPATGGFPPRPPHPARSHARRVKDVVALVQRLPVVVHCTHAELEHMTVHDLKELMRNTGISAVNCLEKKELVAAIEASWALKGRGWVHWVQQRTGARASAARVSAVGGSWNAARRGRLLCACLLTCDASPMKCICACLLTCDASPMKCMRLYLRWNAGHGE